MKVSLSPLHLFFFFFLEFKEKKATPSFPGIWPGLGAQLRSPLARSALSQSEAVLECEASVSGRGRASGEPERGVGVSKPPKPSARPRGGPWPHVAAPAPFEGGTRSGSAQALLGWSCPALSGGEWGGFRWNLLSSLWVGGLGHSQGDVAAVGEKTPRLAPVPTRGGTHLPGRLSHLCPLATK